MWLFLRRGFARFLRLFNRELVVLTPATDPRLARALLIAREQIDLVIDVGASYGGYARDLRRGAKYRGRIVSIEPLSDAFRRLQANSASDPNWQILNLALSDSPGVRRINIAGNSFSSSLLPMLELHSSVAPFSAYVGVEEVRCETLDAIFESLRGDCTNVYLKMDVQGYEKHVLDGARATLAHVRVIEIELSLAPLYEGGPLIDEMIAYLRDAGFDLYSLDRGFSIGATGRHLQFDGIFVRR